MSVTLERGAPAPPPGSRDPRRVPVAPGGPSADELALDALAGHDAAVSFEFDPGGTPTAVLVRPTIHRGEPAAVGCRLCGAGAVPPFLHFHGLTVGRCPQCGAGQVLTIAGSDHDRADDYSARYEAERLESKALTCWELFKEKTNGLQGIRSILDVGCGEGAFLDLARAAGLRTGGIEISPQASLTAIKAGHEVLCSAVPDTPFPADRPFDAVVMWDILEHLREPGQALKDCYDALAPGGRLFVLTPMMGTIYDRLGRTVQRGSRGKVDQLLRMCWSRDHL
ncbi:MAG TPA: class I SAM-dependent methyltransferase, partial [bacterium]|nr:class I SAM-dependent methyltransferase [bacterium]